MTGWIGWLAGAAPADETQKRQAFWVGASILIGLQLVFWAIQIPGGAERKALDAFEYYYPSYLFLYDEIASGSLPLWNPYQLCGIPTLATLQSGLLYPPHILYVLLPTDIAMAISGLLHLALIALSTFVFCRRVGLAWPAALLGAALVGLRGAQVGHLLNPSMQESAAWLGVGFIGVLEIAGERRARGLAWIALATSMSLLAGFPQYGVYAAYAWTFLLLILLLPLHGGPQLRSLALGLPAAVVGVGLGAAMAAVVLWPALELVAVGGRERGSLPLELMFPLGGAGFQTAGEALRTALSIRPALPALPFSFGVVGLLLLPALVLTRRRALTIGVVLLGVLTTIVALGPSTPLFDVYLALPELGSFRNPWRILVITDFCFAVAGALALDAVLQRLLHATSSRARVRLIRAAAVSGTVILLVLGEILLAPSNTTALPYDADDDLLRPYHEKREVLDSLASSPDRVWTWLLGDMGDISDKLASVFHIRSISDVEILTLRRQREYFTWLYWGNLEPDQRNRRGHSQRIFYGNYNILAPGIDVNGVMARSRLAELASARHLLVPRSAVNTPGVIDYLRGRQLAPVDVRDRQIVVFELPRALPRAYVAHGVEMAPPTEELLARLSQHDFDPRQTSYVEASTESLPETRPARGHDLVRIVRDDLHSVEIETRTDAPGLLVLTDSFYPGWQADVDGEPSEILATNHLFRGVALPEGEHRVSFHYRPTSVILGSTISLMAWMAWAALLWVGRRARALEHARVLDDPLPSLE